METPRKDKAKNDA